MQFRILAPLRSGPVALLWGGLAFSAVGDQLYAVALSWVAVGVFGAWAGLLTALGAGCLLVTALFVGRWADGWDQRRAMVGADVVRAGVVLGVVAAWEVAGAPSGVALVVAVVVLGAAQAVFRPAFQAVMPGLVPVAELPAANALFDTTERIARLVGPGLVGVLAAVLPTRHFLSADAGTFLVSAVVLVLIGRGVAPVRRRGVPGSVLGGVARGFRVMGAHPVLGPLMWVNGVVNGAWMAVVFLGLPLALERYGVTGPGGTGLGAYGLVISAYGCTNLVATLVVGSRAMPVRVAPMIFGGSVVVGAGIGLMGVIVGAGLPAAWVLPLLCGAAALAAPGGPMGDVPGAVLRQTELPRDDVPAAMRAYLVVNNLGALVGMVVAPVLFTAVGVAAGIVVCGGLMVAAGLGGLVRCWGVGRAGVNGSAA